MTDTPKRRGRPATGVTPLRNFRIKDEVYRPARQIAELRGESLTEIVESALSRYAVKHRALLAVPVIRSENHGPCATHLPHKLDCAAHEALLARSGGRCERCGSPAWESPKGRLWIDHDPRHGLWATRGLLCPRCNSYMQRVDSGSVEMDDLTAAYLALTDYGPPPPGKVNLAKWDGKF